MSKLFAVLMCLVAGSLSLLSVWWSNRTGDASNMAGVISREKNPWLFRLSQAVFVCLAIISFGAIIFVIGPNE